MSILDRQYEGLKVWVRKHKGNSRYGVAWVQDTTGRTVGDTPGDGD